jgi:hypothetical protein
MYQCTLRALNAVNDALSELAVARVTATIVAADAPSPYETAPQHAPLVATGAALVCCLETRGAVRPARAASAGASDEPASPHPAPPEAAKIPVGEEWHTEAFRAAATFGMAGRGVARADVSSAIRDLHARALAIVTSAAPEADAAAAVSRRRASSLTKYVKAVCTVEHAVAAALGGASAAAGDCDEGSLLHAAIAAAQQGPLDIGALLVPLVGFGGHGATDAVNAALAELGSDALHGVATTLPFVVGSAGGPLGTSIADRALQALIGQARRRGAPMAAEPMAAME